jgi:hypothetical protein
MTPIYRKQIEHPMAWNGSELRKEDIAYALSTAQVVALKDILKKVSETPRDQITREQCSHPALDAPFATLLDEIMNGRGLVCFQGIPTVGHSIEEVEKMYWAIGTHLGTALSQNSLGMRMTRVQEERLADGSSAARGTKSRFDLAMHCDSADVVGLMCVRPAQQGGNTQFSSVLSVHNDLLEKRPDVLPILYKGFPHHRRGEQPDGQPNVTPYDIPIFCNVDGYISSYIAFGSIYAGCHAAGRKITDEEQEALDVLQEAMNRLQFDMQWDAGDACFNNNLAMFHSRSEYVDWQDPAKGRLLLRYWIQPHRNPRPVIPQIHLLENAGHRNGVDPVPGRKIAGNEYIALPPDVIEAIKQGQKKRGVATRQ